MIALATFIAAETWGINQSDDDADAAQAFAVIVMMVLLAWFDLRMATIIAGG